MKSEEIYKNKVIQGLYGEYVARRDLTLAEITKNLEFPETSNIEDLRECFEEIAMLSLVCTQIESMFSNEAERAESGCKKVCESGGDESSTGEE